MTIDAPNTAESSVADEARESTMLRANIVAEVAGGALSQPAVDVAGPPRVLLADDDAPTRVLLTKALEKVGYRVVAVEDGQLAVEAAVREHFDVVLLDAVMPRMSGIDACRTIKGLLVDGYVPIAVVFAKTDSRSRIEALTVGADGCICKPFEETELLLCVSSALRIKRAHDRMRAAKRRLVHLQSFDSLTGAHSFHYLHERLDEEFARAEKRSEPLACFVVDVDRLKVQNERGGRTLGDSVLAGIAGVIRETIRETDIVARYSGDEFFVMLPATHFAGSLVVASRVVREVAQRTFGPESGIPNAQVTVSLGVALFPSRDVRTKESLLRSLEAALAEAKRRGGDRLCVFQQEGFIYTPTTDGGVAGIDETR